MEYVASGNWTLQQPSLSHRLDLPQPANVDDWRMRLPAKGAVYVLADAAERPVLAATTRNLRASLVNRMRPDAADQPTRRTDYAAVCRSVRWRPAFSRFEADWAHLELARTLMPDAYREMVQHRRTWWLHVDPDARFPRFQVLRRPDERAGRWVGPLPTRAAGRAAIEALEEIAQLCRYHEVLRQAPDGAACAYKEMGKCPAPCDGSISMAAYRGQIEQALSLLLGGLADWRAQREATMQAAAAELDFERAGRIKADLDRAVALEDHAMCQAGGLEDMQRLALMPGRRKGCVRAFSVEPGRITFLGEMQRRDREAQAQWLADQAARQLAEPLPELDRTAVERLELAAWHMLRPTEQAEGVFLDRRDATDPQRLLKAAETVGRIIPPEKDQNTGNPPANQSNPTPEHADR